MMEGLDIVLFLGKSKLGLFRGLSSVIVLLIWPYSCWFCRMCRAYADWGLLYLMYHMCS